MGIALVGLDGLVTGAHQVAQARQQVVGVDGETTARSVKIFGAGQQGWQELGRAGV